MTDFTLGLSVDSLMVALNKGISDGIGHYTQQLIEQLAGSSIACKGFVFPKNNLPNIEIRGLLSNHRIPHSYPYYMLKSMLNSSIFDPKIDIFHSTNYKLIPMRCPAVTTLYDAIPLQHPEWGRNTARSLLVNYCIRRSAKFADHVITISLHAAKDIMKHFKIHEKNISVIPVAIDDAWFNPINTQNYQNTLHQYGLTEGYFLSVSTLQPRKNFNALIDAYLALPPHLRKEKKLVIVGKYGWNSEALVQRMKQLQKEGSLLWLSNVHSDNDLRCIYKGASVFVFPSLYEGFGVPVAEAFASGVPVVCSNRTSLPEVSNGAAIEINPESIGEISEAMQYLATNSAARAEKIKLGRIRASELRWKSTLAKTMDVYRQVLDQK